MNFAARDNHLAELIRPALAQGKIVLSDRFADSTRAYQGIAGGCDLSLIDALEDAVVGRTQPDQTFVLDIDPAEGLARAGARGNDGEDRYERKGLGYHEELRQAFKTIAAGDPGRCVLVDAAQSEDMVAEIVWNAVAGKLPA